MRRPTALAAGLLIGGLLAAVLAAVGCTPNEVAAFRTLSPADQQRVIEAVARERAPEGHSGGDCYSALHHFPGDHATARRIIHRESRNDPRAANPRSSARGCWQLLSMHDWRYREVGCSPAQKLEPVCNTKAAAHLYQQAGWTPWRNG